MTGPVRLRPGAQSGGTPAVVAGDDAGAMTRYRAAVIVKPMYRFVTPVPPSKARGLVAAVYAQSVAELGAAFGPHLSPAPDLHAAAWAALRESQLAGRAPRALKE